MTYSVKECFHTLQGEGGQAGRAAVFCRFAGCNLWSGREEDRAAARCQFCDTDFVGTDGVGGGKFESAAGLAAHIASFWPSGAIRPLVVITGGEPLLQLDEALIDALHDLQFEIAVETNGTVKAPAGIDWICVSPKAGNPVVQTAGQELKVVVPQTGLDWDAMSGWLFEHKFVQPMDNMLRSDNINWAVDWVKRNPDWRLSLQTHKLIGLP